MKGHDREHKQAVLSNIGKGSNLQSFMYSRASWLPGRLNAASKGQSGGLMKVAKMIRNVAGTVSLIFAGYVLLSALPDLKRYIRISTI